MEQAENVSNQPTNPPDVDATATDTDATATPAGRDADPVALALATALERASAVGRWDVVVQLGRELEARRLEGSNVVGIGIAKKGRAG